MSFPNQPLTGRCSAFGGPYDLGVGPAEGLALVEPQDLKSSYWRSLFLPVQPTASSALARRLNPFSFSCAMRWKDYGITRARARAGLVKVTNPRLPAKAVYVRPVDFGPGDGSVIDGRSTQNTGRVIDLSNGAMFALQVETDFPVVVEWIEDGSAA